MNKETSVASKDGGGLSKNCFISSFWKMSDVEEKRNKILEMEYSCEKNNKNNSLLKRLF